MVCFRVGNNLCFVKKIFFFFGCRIGGMIYLNDSCMKFVFIVFIVVSNNVIVEKRLNFIMVNFWFLSCY